MQPSDLSCVVFCIHDRLPSTDCVCTDFQASHLPRNIPIWNAGCLTCEYGDARLSLHSVTELWMSWSGKYGMNLSRHYKIRSTFFSELRRLGYRWHYCVSTLSLMVMHTRLILRYIHVYLYTNQSDNYNGSDV